MRIGFDPSTGHVYEGVGAPQFAVVPPPLLSQARRIERPEDWNSLPRGLHTEPFAWVFREDSFDPVTRVRRGRLYQSSGGSQPDSVLTAGHPHFENSVVPLGGGSRTRSLYSYMPCATLLNTANRGLGSTLIIGQDLGVSAWRVIQAEVVLCDDVVVTLKAQSAFGVLPQLDLDAVPAAFHADVSTALERVVDSAFRETPISVIDHCRNAATVVLSRWLVQQGADASVLCDDLGAVAKAMAKQTNFLPVPKECAAWVSQTIARLHPRGKSNEQLSKGLRLPTADDAEFSLFAVAFLLREVGWAKA